jgi:hypothetical protein
LFAFGDCESYSIPLSFHFLGWSVTVTSTIEDISGSSTPLGTTTCKYSVKAVKGYSMTYTSAFVGVAALCMSAAAFFHRKRRVAKIDLLTEEDRAVTGSFEMMSDRSVAV